VTERLDRQDGLEPRVLSAGDWKNYTKSSNSCVRRPIALSMVRAVHKDIDHLSAGYGEVAADAVICDRHAVDHPKRRVQAERLTNNLSRKSEPGYRNSFESAGYPYIALEAYRGLGVNNVNSPTCSLLTVPRRWGA
jgi:hypothetical protein